MGKPLIPLPLFHPLVLSLSSFFAFLSTCDAPRFHRVKDKGGFEQDLGVHPPSKKGHLHKHDIAHPDRGKNHVMREGEAQFAFSDYNQTFFQHLRSECMNS